METSHHTNGHSTVKKVAHALTPIAKKAGARRGVKRAGRAPRRLEAKATSAEREVKSSVRGLLTWAKANPKTAIGVGIGASAIIATLASSRMVRATVIGLAGLGFAAIRRFV
jgi:hypothetical protein